MVTKRRADGLYFFHGEQSNRDAVRHAGYDQDDRAGALRKLHDLMLKAWPDQELEVIN